jgi:hypothetical protein
METTRLTNVQSLRIANLPAGYRVVGIDAGLPYVRKPAGQLMRIRHDGRLIAASVAARRRLEANRSRQQGDQVGELRATAPYTSVMG